MNLKQILNEYVKHRQLVIARRSQYELLAAQERAHILEGLLIALDNLDEVINIIRNSPDADIAKSRLTKKFKLSDPQATAILDMMLRRLAALERKKIEDEYAAIKAKIDYLISLLKDPQKILEVILEELKDIKKTYQDERRTQLVRGKLGEFSEEDLVAAEDVVVTLTQSGYIKRMAPSTYRSQRRGGKGVSGMTTKEGDAIHHILTANTHDNLLVFTNKGKVFKLRVFELPTGSKVLLLSGASSPTFKISSLPWPLGKGLSKKPPFPNSKTSAQPESSPLS
jgi:DNA gyrase subunit A